MFSLAPQLRPRTLQGQPFISRTNNRHLICSSIVLNSTSHNLVACANPPLSHVFLHVLAFLEQLQQFDKSTWHPSNFDKTRKIVLQQFGKPTWQNSPPNEHICARGSWLPSAFPSRWEGEKRNKE
jgi:hypothetical protein